MAPPKPNKPKDPEAVVKRRIAARLRERRMALGLRQLDLARKINISDQQMHKYESLELAMPAARLALFASALEVPLGFFFEDRSEGETNVAENKYRLQLEMARVFRDLDDKPEFQELLVHLARAASHYAQKVKNGAK